jgi:hypothetical protein
VLAVTSHSDVNRPSPSYSICRLLVGAGPVVTKTSFSGKKREYAYTTTRSQGLVLSIRVHRHHRCASTAKTASYRSLSPKLPFERFGPLQSSALQTRRRSLLRILIGSYELGGTSCYTGSLEYCLALSFVWEIERDSPTNVALVGCLGEFGESRLPILILRPI